MITNTELIARLQGFPPGTPVIQFYIGSRKYQSAPKYLATTIIDCKQDGYNLLPEFYDGKMAIII